MTEPRAKALADLLVGQAEGADSYRANHAAILDGGAFAVITPDTAREVARLLACPDGHCGACLTCLTTNRCQNCGGPHAFDTSVPSAVWNQNIRVFSYCRS